MRVYFFVEAKWAVQDIRKASLKVCRLFDLNDPFELLAVDQSDTVLRKKMRAWAAKVNREDGVLCFTTTRDDPLMWSHYGDRHRGVCLGFDASESILTPITYKPHRLAPAQWPLGVSDPPKEPRDALLTTKFARWVYEHEQREALPLADLLPPEGGLYFKPFDVRLRLVEVIAGPRCCVEWKRHITDAVGAFRVKPTLIKARLSFKRFKVVTQKLQGSVRRGFESDSTWQKCTCPKAHDELVGSG